MVYYFSTPPYCISFPLAVAEKKEINCIPPHTIILCLMKANEPAALLAIWSISSCHIFSFNIYVLTSNCIFRQPNKGY